MCEALGPLIALAVSALKRAPAVGAWIEAHAKLVAAALSAVATFVEHGWQLTEPLQLAVCILRSLAAAIATYEVVLKPVGRALL